MAEAIKRDYDIVVLKVQAGAGLGASAGSREPIVRFTLQYHEERALVDGPRWEFPRGQIVPMELDRSTARGQGPSIALPVAMLEGLRDWFTDKTKGRRPLWVHLVKPYGLLRIVPWELALGQALARPILMLPDFIFPPPREAMHVLDVALCGSAPLGYEGHSVHQAMRQAADRILAGTGAGRRVRLHVFADRDIAQPLSAAWKADGRLDAQIVVHDTAEAEPYVAEDLSSRLVDAAGTLRSPWLLWMCKVLADQAIDVVHFICHGHLTRERGALLFAQSPLERSERYLAGPVGAAELGTFLTRVGAWSTVFSSLPDNHSAPGLRWLADEIAQSRPGPMMMHNLAVDPDGAALAAGYAFLYGLEPQAAPESRALFIYCQPYLEAGVVNFSAAPAAPQGMERAAFRSRGSVSKDGTTASPFTVPVSPVARNPLQQEAAARSLEQSPLDRFFGAERVSSLVASTERFAEQVQLQCQQLARDDLLPASGTRSAEFEATFDTLAKLRAAVAGVEARSPSAPSPSSAPSPLPSPAPSGDPA